MSQNIQGQKKKMCALFTVDNYYPMDAHEKSFPTRQRGMYPRTKFPLLIWIFVVSSVFHSTCLALKPPSIVDNTGSITIDPGDTLYLVCEGDAPLKWISTDTEDLESDGRVNITNTNGNSLLRPYSSTLTLKDVGYSDAIFFTCLYDGILDELEDSVHVFVPADQIQTIILPIKLRRKRDSPTDNQPLKDEDQLFARNGAIIESPFVHWVPGQRGVIPCRPASKDVKMQIIRESKTQAVSASI
ncbi:unnamed protein product [Orchesella dallaii]|uniref:Ig-like domain-containing protein n=1 Tax=Orchesella dallaii TaxID=48710 RepID=A0ABP1PXP5_9HEXA